MQKTSTFNQFTFRLWKLLKPDRSEIKNIYIYAIFKGIVNLSLPLGIQAIINLIQGGQVSSSWILLVFLVVLGVVITGILQIYQMRITENLQQKIFVRAAYDLAYRVTRVKQEILYRYYPPELMNRFFDTVSVQKGFSKVVIDFSTAVINVIFSLILLSLYHTFFLIFSLVLVSVIFLVLALTFRKGMQTSLQESKYKYKIAHWLEELARTSTTFKLAGQTNLPLQKTDVLADEYVKSREKHFGVLVLQYSLSIALRALIATSLLAIGGLLVFNQQMNIGQFVAAEIIILTVMSNAEKLILSFETIYDVLTSLEKIGQVTDLELEDEGLNKAELDDKQCFNLELVDVHFKYPGAEKEIIKGLDLKIKQGEKIVIVGANGSGKSTLLSLICGLYKVTNGNLLYNGINQRTINLDSLRTRIGDCLSQEMVFEGTIRENIELNRKGVSRENTNWAVNNVGLGEYVRKLELGLDTMIDPQGQKLPKNVVQKIILARAIAEKPSLLVFDNIFEELNEDDKKQVIDFLLSQENNWTIVASTNNETFIQKADKVVYLEDGKILKIIENQKA